MSQVRFDVVFYGEIMEGFELLAVKKKFRELSSLTEARVDKVFAARKVVLRPSLEPFVADKYRQVLTDIGVKVYLESIHRDEAIAAISDDLAAVVNRKIVVAKNKVAVNRSEASGVNNKMAAMKSKVVTPVVVVNNAGKSHKSGRKKSAIFTLRRWVGFA